MRSTTRLAAVGVVMALAAACGPGSSPVAHVTSSPSAIASASPAPQLGVCDATNQCLALVTLRGSNQVVVRDVTDIEHPATVSNLSSVAQFVNASEVSYADAENIYTMPLSGGPTRLVANKTIDFGLFAWSSDGTRVAYLTDDGVHVISSGSDRTFGGSLPQAAGGYGCESQACADGWDSRLAFSPDGAFISLLVLSGPVAGFRLWSSDGKTVAAPKSQGPTMSVWSGRTFFYRDADGVEAWRDGVTSKFLPGVEWVRPKGSPAGGLLVYEVRDGSGLAHVYTVDTVTGNARELRAGRREPAFLTSRYVWYAGERMCVASDNCVTGPTVATGKTYIYDLQTGTEYDSVITNVYDVWPHAA